MQIESKICCLYLLYAKITSLSAAVGLDAYGIGRTGVHVSFLYIAVLHYLNLIATRSEILPWINTAKSDTVSAKVSKHSNSDRAGNVRRLQH